MRQKLHNIFSSAIVTLFVSAVLLIGCAGTLSSVEMPFPNLSRHDLMVVTQRSIMSLGYQIKSTNESAGLIQAFRPMTGSFSKPGYGHNISIEVDNQKIKVTVFPMEGVIGGEPAEQIRRQIEDKIHENVK